MKSLSFLSCTVESYCICVSFNFNSIAFRCAGRPTLMINQSPIVQEEMILNRNMNLG